MWRSKKFIIVAVLATVVLVGSISGVVLAQSDNGDDNQPPAQQGALLDKVCEIYEQNTGVAIDPQELQNAYAQARSEMLEEALENRLQNLVEQGKITQEEADQYKAWWQGRPDMEPFRQQLREWEEARPDVPIAPGPLAPRFPGRGMHPGFGGPGGGFPGWFEPPPTAE